MLSENNFKQCTLLRIIKSYTVLFPYFKLSLMYLSICFFFFFYCCSSYPSQFFPLFCCFCFIFFLKRARTGATAATQKNLCIIKNVKKEFLIAICVILEQITFSLKLCCEMPFVMVQLIKES